MSMTRKRAHWHSTEAIELSILHTEYTLVIPKRSIQCGGFMLMSIEVDDKTHPSSSMLIICLASNGSQVGEDLHYPLQEQPFNTELREENYYRFEEKQFKAKLRFCYPSISGADAEKVTETVMGIIQIANATHRCPESDPGSGFAISHHVQIWIEPCSSSSHVDAPSAPGYDTLYEEEEEEAEVVRPRVRPATTASIIELLKDSKRMEGGRGEQCSICMEDMETTTLRNRLRMPCSHWFHCACLLHWLNKRASCPLCRYEMPAAEYESE